jgi:hypothetical protein
MGCLDFIRCVEGASSPGITGFGHDPHGRDEIKPTHGLHGRDELDQRPLGYRLADRLLQTLHTFALSSPLAP